MKSEGCSRAIELEGRRVTYVLRRSDRARWVRAEVGLRTGLRVTLPAAMDESEAARFLQVRRRWVLRALARFERLASRVPERPLTHGSTVPFLGLELALDLRVGGPSVERRGETLVVHVPRRTAGAVRRVLGLWYVEQAGREFVLRVQALAERHGLSYRRVRVGDSRRRWGTCSSKGAISLNWRILLAPEPVVDYLVAHELSHLVEPNHSDRFWEKVGELCPAWRDQERWLRRFGVGLIL